jgi:transposase
MLRLRDLTEDEHRTIGRLVHARSTPVGKLKRAQIIRLARQGHFAPEIAQQLGVGADMVRLRLKRFNAQGLSALDEAPRSGRPTTYTSEEVSIVIQTALSKPQELGEDYAMWTLDRLVEHLQRVRGIHMKRSRISEIFIAEGLSWRQDETWFGKRVDPDFAKKRGPSKPSPPRLQNAV